MSLPKPYYERGPVRIFHGDCLALLPEMEAGSVDAVVTDPPYAIPTMVASGRNNIRNIGDLSLIEHAFQSIFRAWSIILSESGRAFIFCDGTSYSVVFRASYGEFSTALLVWNKGQFGMGREFRKSHELLLHCWRPSTPVFFDGIGRPDVLDVAPVGVEREHPAEKPTELIEKILTVCGNLIVDPFLGSGTTAVACIRTGRNCIGIEIEEKYCEIAAKRCDRELDQGRLFKPEPPRETQRTLIGEDE